jgi:hypothetical protein
LGILAKPSIPTYDQPSISFFLLSSIAPVARNSFKNTHQITLPLTKPPRSNIDFPTKKAHITGSYRPIGWLL